MNLLEGLKHKEVMLHSLAVINKAKSVQNSMLPNEKTLPHPILSSGHDQLLLRLS